MIRLIQRRLIVPRGDTGTFSIPVLAGKDTGDVSIFTVFDPLMHRKIFEKVMTLSGETLTMELTHGDTVNLPVGQYVWDIKFYTDPIFAEEKLIGGTEVDSYYAAFTLPVCEIRETGDNLLMSDDAPTGALKPGQIDFVTASINEMTSLKNTTTIRAAEADTSAQNAESSASAAAASEAAAQDSQVTALASQQAAQAAASEAANSAAMASQKAAQITADLATKADKNEIPTLVSQLQNDVGYLNQETDPTVPAWAKQAQKPSYTAQEVGALPADTVIPTVPTNISAFINDSGYLTVHQDISGKADKSEIPTSVSELTNDAGYLTSFTETDPTVPAWAKATTKPSYTAAEVGAPTMQEMNSAISTAIGNVNSFDMAVVQELPIQNINTHSIYLVPKTGETNDVYDEYIYINNAWEMIGNTQIDLSNYVQKTDYATDTEAGVIKIANADVESALDSQSGGSVLINGKLYYVGAPAQIQYRIASNHAALVSTANQHLATFYGLARAAGDSTQTASNAVGVYTAEAKTAIQNMLDVPSKSDLTNLIAISNSAPQDGDAKIWIDTDDSSTVQVPTVAEMNLALALKADADDIPEVPVQDVQVNGQSVLSGGVANVPLATNYTPGAVIGSATGGIIINANGKLQISGAYNAIVKEATNNILPITSAYQHAAAFYGLAKAAGDSTQAASDNAVGIYTDEAKSAIQNMLNVPDVASIPFEYGTSSGSIQVKPWIYSGQVWSSTASGAGAFAMGHNTAALGIGSFSQGSSTHAIGTYSCTQGSYVSAFGDYSYATGNGTRNTVFTITDTDNDKEYTLQTSLSMNNDTLLPYIHGVITVDNILFAIIRQVEVMDDRVFKITLSQTIGQGYDNERCTIYFTFTNGEASYTAGNNLIADSNYQFIQGKSNVIDSNNLYAHIVGNGTSVITRSNAYALTWTGDGKYAGDVYVGANADSSGGTKLAKITDIPDVPVQDVQINGSSILDDGIANIPYASSSVAGVIKYDVNSFTVNPNNGKLIARFADESAIKTGSGNVTGVCPKYQHISVFYGLSKVAGVDLANETVTLGVYPDTSKAAIQNMLGISDLIATRESSTATATHTLNSIFLMDGKLYKTTSAIGIGDAVAAGTNCTQVNIAEAFATQDDLSLKADKTNTVLNTTLSCGRKEGTTIGSMSFAFGNNVEASNNGSFANGSNTIASGQYSNASNSKTTASGDVSHAEGHKTIASGEKSHAEGYISRAAGYISHAQGEETNAEGRGSHAEGYSTWSKDDYSHAEGSHTVAYGVASHSEGSCAVMSGTAFKLTGAENATTYSYTTSGYDISLDTDTCIFLHGSNLWAKIIAIDKINHTITVDKSFGIALNSYSSIHLVYGGAFARGSHIEGISTIATQEYQHVQGQYNIKDINNLYADIIGNGTGHDTRSNAYALEWTGTGRYAGDVYVGCNNDSTGGTRLATVTELAAKLDAAEAGLKVVRLI